MVMSQTSQARAFLAGNDLVGRVPAREFSEASAELGKDFAETLKLLLEAFEQGRGIAPLAMKFSKKG